MKSCIVIFGRMNIPHNGHGLLFKKALFLREQNPELDIRIFLSTQQNIKNPLPFDVKVKYIKKLFPEIQDFIQDNSSSEIFSIMKRLDSEYDKIILLAGSDRVQHFQQILDMYNGSQYEYQEIEVLDCGNRNDNTLSGTKMRSYVYAYDYENFSTSLPDVPQELKEEFFNVCKGYMRNEL